MAELLIEILGWFGTAIILLAYFLLTTKKVKGESKTYNGLNLIGGLLLVINTISNSAYPPAALNIVWNIIAIYGIMKGLKIFR